MSVREGLNIHGSAKVTLFRANGDVEVLKQDNMIVNSGFDFICDVIGKDTQPGDMTHIAVGTGTTAVAATQTTLVTEINRQAATYAHTVGTKVFTLTATFAAGVATGAITEAGVFNAASAGTMLDRVVFSVVNKGADDVMTVQFQFTLS